MKKLYQELMLIGAAALLGMLVSLPAISTDFKAIKQFSVDPIAMPDQQLASVEGGHQLKDGHHFKYKKEKTL